MTLQIYGFFVTPRQTLFPLHQVFHHTRPVGEFFRVEHLAGKLLCTALVWTVVNQVITLTEILVVAEVDPLFITRLSCGYCNIQGQSHQCRDLWLPVSHHHFHQPTQWSNTYR